MARGDEAVRLANSLDTPYSVAQALLWRLALLNDRRSETLADAATEVRRYCDEQGFPAMGGGATAFLGLALNDLDVILEGTGVLAATGTLLMAPSACMWIADSYLAQGLYDDALAMIDAGLDLGVSTRQHYYDSPASPRQGRDHPGRRPPIGGRSRQGRGRRVPSGSGNRAGPGIEVVRLAGHDRPGPTVAEPAAAQRGSRGS